MNPSRAKDSTLLCPQTISKRRLPVNFDPNDLQFFSHELEKTIPAARVLELENVNVSADGILFRGLKMLPESFAFPANMELWRRRSVLKFFTANHLAKRTRKIEQPILWITDDWSNGYFHWLGDVLPRLYVMRNQLSEFTLGLPADFERKDFVSASLKCFGVNSVVFVGADEVWHCRKVVMPTHLAPSGHYNEEIIRAVRAVLLECVAGGATGAGERIYISRARARKRRILNETEVVEILNQFGFQTIYAEDHSFAEQVKIASRARYLVSNHGAGLTNMLFMPDGASVLELRHDADCVSNCYFTLSSALGLNYFYQTCRANGPDAHFADLTIDTKKLKETLTAFLT